MLVCLLSFTFLYVFITCIAAFVRNKLMMMMMIGDHQARELMMMMMMMMILTSYGLRTANTLLGELLREAVGTERLLIARSKLLSDQHLVAPGACETFAMPWRALVRYSALVDHLRSGKQLRIRGGSIYRKYRDCRRYR